MPHKNDYSGTGTGNVLVAVTAAVGDTIVVFCNNRNSLPTGVTDAAGNTYTLVDSNSNNPSFLAAYVCTVTAPLTAQNITVAYGSGFGEAIAMVADGIDTVTPVRDHNSGFQSLATNLTISTIAALAKTGDLVYGAFGNKAGAVAFTKGASYTLGIDVSNSTSQLSTEWKTATAAGNQTADGTYGTGTTLSDLIVVLSAAAAPAGGLPTLRIPNPFVGPMALRRLLRGRLRRLASGIGVGPVTTVPVGAALETDTALALGANKARPAAVATETDTALAFGRLKTKALGAAIENDTAQTLGRAKAKQLGLAAETDASQPVGQAKRRTIAAAAETDTAQPLGRSKTRTITAALESDVALTFGRAKAKLLGLANETDSALTITKSGAKFAALLTAVETDTALAFGRLKKRALGAALEATSALTLGRRKTRAVGAAGDTSAAQPLQRTKTRQLGTATATNTALPLGRAKRAQLTAAVEVDTAIAIAGHTATQTVPAVGEILIGPRTRTTILISNGPRATITIRPATAAQLVVDVRTDATVAVEPATRTP